MKFAQTNRPVSGCWGHRGGSEDGGAATAGDFELSGASGDTALKESEVVAALAISKLAKQLARAVGGDSQPHNHVKNQQDRVHIFHPLCS